MPMYKHIHKTKGDAGSEDFDPYNVLRKATEDGGKPVKHDVVEIGTKDDIFTNSNWKPGPVGKGSGKPGSESYDTKPVEAQKPTGRYAKRGGTGKGYGE